MDEEGKRSYKDEETLKLHNEIMTDYKHEQ
jgi:hypothetical protein